MVWGIVHPPRDCFNWYSYTVTDRITLSGPVWVPCRRETRTASGVPWRRRRASESGAVMTMALGT
jgi:hypothetical protein